MIEVTVFLGKSFNEGTEYDTFNFPAVPKTGDVIRQVEGPRQIIKEVEFFLNSDRTASIRVLVESERSSGGKYNLKAWS